MSAADAIPLSRHARRAQGVYYTPPAVADFIVRRAWDAWRGSNATEASPRVLEPSCGAGAFLQATRRVAREQATEVESLWGIDPDADALETAKADGVKLLHGDALDDRRLTREAFDLIVGNPPYVNVRQLPKTHSAEQIAAWRSRFRTARGNFDLYVLFLERACELLAPGGVCGFIVPNKFAVLDYARACRELLLEQTIVEVADLSQLRVFPDAGVYPYVLIFRKAPPAENSRVKIRTFTSLDELTPRRLPAPRTIRQSTWSAERFTLAADLEVEARVSTQPLGERATIHSGASGYTAQQLAKLLHEANDDSSGERPFIVSGNIDPYAIQQGDVRFLGARYVRPALDLNSEQLSAGKRRLYAAPKIVIAGLAERLEAAWDATGVALGVQVFAVTDAEDDPFYLLGLLNSRLLTALFRTRFAAKKLAGNYFAVNKGQLAQLPIRVAKDANARRRQRAIARLAQRLHETAAASPAEQAALDRLILEHYAVHESELESLETASAVIRRAA